SIPASIAIFVPKTRSTYEASERLSTRSLPPTSESSLPDVLIEAAAGSCLPGIHSSWCSASQSDAHKRHNKRRSLRRHYDDFTALFGAALKRRYEPPTRHSEPPFARNPAPFRSALAQH